MNKSLWLSAKPHVLAIGLFLLVSCIYCLPAFQGLIVAQPDLTGWRGMAQQSIEFKERYGHYPLWTQSTFSGMPTFQIIVGSAFEIHIAYLHHLFTMFLPEPAGLFFLACLGFYILCMALRIRVGIAVLASLAYAFASYNAIIVAVGHTTKFSSMSYAPAVLAGLVLLTQRRYLLGFIVTLVFSTQLFYQNHVQIVYYTLLTALCLGITHAIHAVREKQFRHLAKAAGLAALAGLMGLLSFAVVLFPTYDYTAETMRGGRSELSAPGGEKNKSAGGLDKDYAFGFSYGITEVLTIAVPRLYGGSSGEMPAESQTARVLMDRTGMDPAQADQYARSLPAYWGPQGGTAGAVYFGAAVCVLFLFGLFFYKGWHAKWILAATILGVLLAWGKHFSTLNYFLFDYLPFYNKFRAPSMAMVIPQLGFPLLAALGLQQFLDRKPAGIAFSAAFRRSLIACALFLGLFVLLYVFLDFKGPHDEAIREQLAAGMQNQLSRQGPASPEIQQQAQAFGREVVHALRSDRKDLFWSDLLRSALFMALAVGALYLFYRTRMTPRVLLVALTALVFIDLIGVDLRYLSSRNFVDEELFTEVFEPTPANLQILQDTGYFRVFHSGGDPFQSSPQTSRTSYLHNNVGGYHPAKLALYNDLIQEHLSRGNLAVFNMLNTRYFIMEDPRQNREEVQLNSGALGPAWFVKGIRFVQNADEEIRALDDFQPADTAVMDIREKARLAFEPVPDSTAVIQLLENRNDVLRYRSHSEKPGFAVFSEIYYPRGWKAYVDGKETPILRTNYVLRGLALPAGEHEILFEFAPRSYTLGNITSMIVGLLSILILLWGAIVLWRHWRNTQAITT